MRRVIDPASPHHRRLWAIRDYDLFRVASSAVESVTENGNSKLPPTRQSNQADVIGRMSDSAIHIRGSAFCEPTLVPGEITIEASRGGGRMHPVKEQSRYAPLSVANGH